MPITLNAITGTGSVASNTGSVPFSWAATPPVGSLMTVVVGQDLSGGAAGGTHAGWNLSVSGYTPGNSDGFSWHWWRVAQPSEPTSVNFPTVSGGSVIAAGNVWTGYTSWNKIAEVSIQSSSSSANTGVITVSGAGEGLLSAGFVAVGITSPWNAPDAGYTQTFNNNVTDGGGNHTSLMTAYRIITIPPDLTGNYSSASATSPSAGNAIAGQTLFTGSGGGGSSRKIMMIV